MILSITFMLENSDSFRILPNKILATHLFAQGWAPNFWSYLNLRKIDKELTFIQSAGFNTVIIVIPWVGFQTHVDPITYHEEYFALFEQLLQKTKIHGLNVILRLGYSHDNGPHSEPEGFLRQIAIGAHPTIMAAWCDYLDKFWLIVKHYPHVLGGFISWEDFFLMDLTHIPLEQRLSLAIHTGYQQYLEQHYTLAHISTLYHQLFYSYSEIPIPAFKTQGICLFCEFWDKLLINTVFATSKQHFPPLTMEVRTDCEPLEEGKYMCHHDTFDVAPDTPLTIIYYSPAWGASNDGNQESATEILKRMEFMLNQVRAKTNNAIFIDQFNFIDNTPGFEQHTRISPEELPYFLNGAAEIIRSQTVGYGLWTLHDVPANILKNGLFERNYPSWEIFQGEIVFDSEYQQHTVLLQAHGILSQKVTYCLGVAILPDVPFNLDFQLNNSYPQIEITVQIVKNEQVIHERLLTTEKKGWQKVHLTEIPFKLGYELRLINQGKPTSVSDFYLYQLWQENGIIDTNAQPKHFYQHLIGLNQKLSHSDTVNSFFYPVDITPQQFDGIFADRWMGASLSGLITYPQIQAENQFIVRVYVPEKWESYQNTLVLTLNNQPYFTNQAICNGYNELLFTGIQTNNFNYPIRFTLTAEKVFSLQLFEPHSQDNRQLSVQLLEFGFVNV